MSPRISGLLIALIIVGCFAAGALVYPQLPMLMVTHWSASGTPNGGMTRFFGTFTIPFLLVVLMGVWALLPQIDPIGKGFTGFRFVYDFFWILLTAFFAYVYALVLGINLGWHLDLMQGLLPALAALFIILGLLMPYIRRNWFMGIRTPWTLSSDRVWDETHKLGSVLVVIAGILVLGGLFYSHLALWFIVVPIVAAALISVVYSYVLYRRYT